MGPLDLDFHRPPRSSPLGWLLFLAGTALFAALGALHHQWLEETQALQATARRLEARLPQATPARANKETDLALAAARKALDETRLPWDRLFATLEAADNQDVALLGINPDGPRRQVKLQAEARDLAAMLAYQRRLEQGGGLRQVTLIDHDTAVEAPETPVRFHISAAWE